MNLNVSSRVVQLLGGMNVAVVFKSLPSNYTLLSSSVPSTGNLENVVSVGFNSCSYFTLGTQGFQDNPRLSIIHHHQLLVYSDQLVNGSQVSSWSAVGGDPVVINVVAQCVLC